MKIMPSQAQREMNFIWRPNTNDSTTLARYDQEAQHWVRAFKNASRPKASFSATIGTIGLVLSLIVNLIWLVGLLGARVINWIRNQ